jgi:Arc/MetJ-type ribon-helix-helix transcriptional regulator
MRKTMNISMSEDMYDFVLDTTRSRLYSSTSEYVRTLIRKDRYDLAANPSDPIGEIRQGMYGADPETEFR